MLQAIGFAAQAIADALVAVFNVAEDFLEDILTGLGYAADVIGDILCFFFC